MEFFKKFGGKVNGLLGKLNRRKVLDDDTISLMQQLDDVMTQLDVEWQKMLDAEDKLHETMANLDRVMLNSEDWAQPHEMAGDVVDTAQQLNDETLSILQAWDAKQPAEGWLWDEEDNEPKQEPQKLSKLSDDFVALPEMLKGQDDQEKSDAENQK